MNRRAFDPSDAWLAAPSGQKASRILPARASRRTPPRLPWASRPRPARTPSLHAGGHRTETLRVCLLAPEFLPVRGGVGTYSVGLVRELSRIADVTVLTLTRRQGSAVYGRAEMEAAVDHRARVLPIADARDTFVYNARFQIALLRQLPSFVHTERIEVVHSQHAHMPDLLAGPMTSGPPIVRTVHSTIAGQREAIRIFESLGQSPDVTERWQLAIEPFLRTAEWSTLHRPGLLFPVCQFAADHLVDLGIDRRRMRVIHNGVDSERFQPGSPAGASTASEARRPTVLFVGRFTMVKGIGTLMQAVPRVVQAVPEVVFQFTGALPPQLDQWFSLPPELRRHLEFLGYVPDSSLPTLYRSATVAVAPSLLDWFPFSVLEAMAAGAAIVTSRVGGIPEAITAGEDGLLVEPGSSEQLADAVIDLLQDPSRRARLASHARRRATTEFSWQRTARATHDGYREALALGPVPSGVP